MRILVSFLYRPSRKKKKADVSQMQGRKRGRISDEHIVQASVKGGSGGSSC